MVKLFFFSLPLLRKKHRNPLRGGSEFLFRINSQNGSLSAITTKQEGILQPRILAKQKTDRTGCTSTGYAFPYKTICVINVTASGKQFLSRHGEKKFLSRHAVSRVGEKPVMFLLIALSACCCVCACATLRNDRKAQEKEKISRRRSASVYHKCWRLFVMCYESSRLSTTEVRSDHFVRKAI